MSVSPLRAPRAIAALLGASLLAVLPAPAKAQFGGIVYDPSNYAQNVLTAARALQQVNNQLRQIENQTQSLLNEARNLASLPLSLVAPIEQQLDQTRQLLRQAQRLSYNVDTVQSGFAARYRAIDLSASDQALVAGAQSRWQDSVAAFEDALKIQALTVGHLDTTRQSLTSLMQASQDATGALQAIEAGNQILAVQSQQLADLAATIAAQGRAQTLDAAGAAAAKTQAREQLRRFLSPGSGYVADPVTLFHE
ncbi:MULTISPECIES: P-type conjugative transfer protein TrbJ [unclassified Novosphingobium]|uniref:P-type conjugative transfer protein TrbJ n=1 Tax=unclassified Novosphingobium TaxID=2644732 RepID=UPI00146C333E|nr:MULTISPECIES: P-type conjugative transfer protein TrbJ [unclassified Novosphingobium]NMN04832.1 P-type conjugative transfer protein TrbJ [Novosphingobium sp. SG919]NMN85174.1 P-type conjugative transfer protein TrbJ [Novosphingobium sp. SG916]